MAPNIKVKVQHDLEDAFFAQPSWLLS